MIRSIAFGAFGSLLAVLWLCSAGTVQAAVEEAKAPGRKMAIQATKAKPVVQTMTADHSKFKELQFDPEKQKTMKPEEVTEACLGCHNLAGLQFHKTIHWTWRDMEGQPKNFGKGGLSVNNF